MGPMMGIILLLASTNCSVVQTKNQSSITLPFPPLPPLSPSLVRLNEKKYEQVPEIKDLCGKIDSSFARYKWGKSDCLDYPWKSFRKSLKGTALGWMVFQNFPEKEKGEFLTPEEQREVNITLIICGVHGDEITPVKFCLDVAKMLKEEGIPKHGPSFEKHHPKHGELLTQIIVVPIANPDSFFISKPSRTNARGIDINRNFPTKDWRANALKVWKNRYKSDPRKYPGKSSLSEPETIFQVNLIKLYSPDKIISVHAPLTLIDYDGPTLTSSCAPSELLKNMSAKSSLLKIMNYPFFPGSIGNWAGNERKIPTYTLELPSSSPEKHQYFWELFKEVIQLAIESPLKL